MFGNGNQYVSSSVLLGHHKDESIVALPVDELIEKGDGFADVFPGNVYILVAFYSFCKLQILIFLLFVNYTSA